MSSVVAFEQVSKRYYLGAGQASLREVLYALPRRLLGRVDRSAEDRDHIWALKDVSFDLRPGQVLGIVGRNGAGKTTTLKLLSWVVRPTSGRVHVDGRVSALIELGAGFHPDLTGRENVYLNGVILGLSRREIDRRFASIVEFAELARFIDTPVKRYSSGMYARLGFAVAAHVDPEILLVDEVLSVGDESFKQKCYAFVHSFVKSGRTAVFVSHSMYVVEQLCDRLLWLENGQIAMSGTTREVLSAYLDRMDQLRLDAGADTNGSGALLRVGPMLFADRQGRQKNVFASGGDVVMELRYEAARRIERPHFHFGVMDPRGGGPIFTASMLVDGDAPPFISGSGSMTCTFRGVPLTPKTYDVWVEVWGADRAEILVKWQRVGAFRIAGGQDDLSALGTGAITRLRADAPVFVPYEWGEPGSRRPSVPGGRAHAEG